MASASPASAPRWNHEVFLSFRGVDTRKGITSHLYDSLQNMRGIKTFMDIHDLEAGDVISPRLLTAIKESRFAIVVMSENYASSTWCLEELTTIFQCMKDKNRILPLFYQVDPSHVRHQGGNFKAALTKHVSRQGIEKVNQWRLALTQVANLSGWDSKNYVSDRELVLDIVKFVWSKVLQLRIETGLTTRDFEAFEATRLAMDEVMNALKDDRVAVIGVYGMGGVGKTTMVKHVGAQARENGLFDKVIMAVVSQVPDVKKIQAQLAEMLALKLEGDTEVGRAYTLKETIMRRNMILIILDDIWRKIELSSIGIPSNNELRKCNSKILLTTRIRNVCHTMGSQVKIPLQILSDQDSWRLFMKTTGKSFHESTNLYDVARKVARECAGLPIALKAIAGALGDKDDLDEWKEAARRLQMSQNANLDDDDDGFKCIKLSYDYLNSNEAKSCFLLCCLFPEDDDIRIADLMKYGFGKGLFRDADTIEEARGQANLVVKYLRACSLLLDGREEGCVRMHDVIRDTALKIALLEDGHRFFVKASRELKDWPVDAHEGHSAISLMRNKICKLPKELVCPKLEILLLQHNAYINEIPNTFFQSSNAVRVLDLSNTTISLLTPSLSFLNNLRTLYLDGCKSVIDVSILGKLITLEILSMREFPLTKFPKEIGNLTNLRMLDVTHGLLSMVPSKVISRLCRLEALYMQDNNFGDWGSKVEEAEEETNAGFDELTDLSSLKFLEVSISDVDRLPKTVASNPNWVNFDIVIKSNIYPSLRPPSLESGFSRTLTLDTTITSLPDWFINVVTEKAEKLQYFECRGLNNILVEYDHGRLHGLKYLAVIDPQENMTELMNTTTRVSNKPVYRNLEGLLLSGLTYLKELCIGGLPPGSLCNLKTLEVGYCPNLENALLPSKLLQRLQNLEKLICVNMMKMDYVFGCQGLKQEESILTKLEELHLSGLYSLKKLCVGESPPGSLCNLKIIKVEDCGNLLNTFLPSKLLRGLQNVKELICRGIDKGMEYVFGREGLEPCSIHESLCNLKILEVGYCPNLENALLPSKLLPRLQNLKKLICVNTIRMEYVFGSQGLEQGETILTKLEELHLTGNPCLKELCFGELPSGSLCNLKIFKVEDCDNLVNTFLPSTLLRGLQNVKQVICRGRDNGMEYVFRREGIEPEVLHHTNRWKIPGRRTIFLNIKILAVSKCMKLKYLFTPDVAQGLLQLEDLWIANCDSLQVIIKPSEVDFNKIIIFPQLKNVVLRLLPLLKRFYIRRCPVFISAVSYIECPSLEHLHLWKCPGLQLSKMETFDFYTTSRFQVNNQQHFDFLQKRLFEDRN